MGVWGDAKEVTLTSYHPSFAVANTAAIQYERQLPSRQVVPIVYEGVNHGNFLVLAAKSRVLEASRVCGPGFNYTNGAKVEVTLTIQPLV